MIHGNKSIPNFSCSYPERMKQGEIYALETYPRQEQENRNGYGM